MKKKLCSCNQDIRTALTYARGVYHPHDRVLLSLGATRRPVSVEIRCTRCEHTFAVTDDRRLRERACARDWLTREDIEAAQATAAA